MYPSATLTHVCDGCGAAVNAAHVQDRIRRLERATRFRPLHIHTLLLVESSPRAAADDFYAAGESLASAAAHEVPGQNRTGRYTLLDTVARAAGVAGEGKPREEILAGLQRAGVFLACVRECAAEEPGGGACQGDSRPKIQDARPGEPDAETIQRLVLRVRFSYKPKHVIAMGQRLCGVVPALAQAGYAAEVCAGPEEATFESGLRDALRRAGM